MLQKVNKLFNLKIIFAALKTSISYRSIFLLALPIIISGISQNIVTVVDTAFLGALGIAELGAAGNMGILYLLMLTIGMGYTNGAQIIIARRNGESNFDKIDCIDDVSHTESFPLQDCEFPGKSEVDEANHIEQS